MFQNLIDIIVAPTAAFDRIKEKPTVLLPLLLILLSTISIQVGYIMLSDFGFIIDQQVEQAAAFVNVPEDQIREGMANATPTGMAMQAGISTAIIIVLILSLNALYLSFMSKFSFSQLGWKSWMSLICWTGIPGLFAVLASWVALLSDDNGQLSQAALQPLSITGLLDIDTGNAVLQQFHILQFWSMALLALGYQRWTQKSLLASAIITLAPTILIYGGLTLATL
ncbi:MAG: YIP1 family protein [Pseudomonadota bacterium]